MTVEVGGRIGFESDVLRINPSWAQMKATSANMTN